MKRDVSFPLAMILCAWIMCCVCCERAMAEQSQAYDDDGGVRMAVITIGEDVDLDDVEYYDDESAMIEHVLYASITDSIEKAAMNPDSFDTLYRCLFLAGAIQNDENISSGQTLNELTDFCSEIGLVPIGQPEIININEENSSGDNDLSEKYYYDFVYEYPGNIRLVFEVISSTEVTLNDFAVRRVVLYFDEPFNIPCVKLIDFAAS